MDPDEEEPSFGAAITVGSETTEAEREYEKVNVTFYYYLQNTWTILFDINFMTALLNKLF